MERRKSKKLLSMLVAGLLLCFPGSYVSASGAAAQDGKTVTGTVVDVQGEPMIGVTVSVQGTKEGVVTDMNGRYSIRVQNDRQTLLFSYIGYQSVTVVANKDLINVTMTEDSKTLDEVVVVGYGTQKRVNLTGAVSTVDVSKTLEARPQADVMKGLQGVVPGLTILVPGGELNRAPEIRIRGVGTLSNDAVSNPLILVDGVAMDDISYLNTQDIENVSVLKDAASTSIYGARAAFGVILITTKSAKKVDRNTLNYTNNFAWETPTMLPNYPDLPTQLRALLEASKNSLVPGEQFDMYFSETLPKAIEWQERHGWQKADRREMVYGDDFEIIGDRCKFYADWDVVGIMFRKWRPAQNHNVSIQGSSGKTNYFASFGYSHQEGIMKMHPDLLDKYSVMTNLNTQVFNWLKVGTRVSYNTKDFTYPYNYRTPNQYIWRWGSNFPLGTWKGYDWKMETAYQNQASDCFEKDEYTRLGGYAQATIIKGLTVDVDYTYNIRNYMDKFSGGPVYAWDFWTAKAVTIDGSPTDISGGIGYNDMRMYTRQSKSYAFNAFATYEFTLAKKHNLKAMAGVNVEEGDRFGFWGRSINLFDKDKPEFPLTDGKDPNDKDSKNQKDVNGYHNQWGACGYFGRLNYDFAGKYLLELNGRYDGSSEFPRHSRWAFFPSFSAGYRISEEAFMQSLKPYLSEAKPRVSYGEIGNQAVGGNKFISLVSVMSTPPAWIDGGSRAKGFGMPGLVSETLFWERVLTTNVGGDFGFLNNELMISVDWFQRDTKDMLGTAGDPPQVLGTGAPYENLGAMQSKGWEFTLNWRHRFNDLNVYVSASLGDYVTKITKWNQNTNKFLNQNYEGKTVGEIWGFETDRLYQWDDFELDANGKLQFTTVRLGNQDYQVYKLKGDDPVYQALLQQGSFRYQPGDIKFKDLNNDGTINGGDPAGVKVDDVVYPVGTLYNHGDLKVIGNRTPRYQYTFRVGGDWKGFDLDAFFQGVGKRQEWTTSAFVMPFMRGEDALYANQTDYYSEDPDNVSGYRNYDAFFPRPYLQSSVQGYLPPASLALGRYNFYPQSRYLVNMAYLRLKNLTFGYTIPKVITQKALIQKARIYFSAGNVCELYRPNRAAVDPEVDAVDRSRTGESAPSLGNGTWGRVDPPSRSYSFGIQVTF